MAFRATREGVKPCGDFGGAIAADTVITIKKIVFNDDNGVILQFAELKGCLCLDEPCSSAFAGAVQRFMDILQYVEPGG